MLRILTGAFLALVSITSALADCYDDHCTASIGQRNCYGCCNTNCTDAVACQNRCDGVSKILPIIRGIDANSKQDMDRLWQRDMFNLDKLSSTGVNVIEWGYVKPTNPDVLRMTVVVAADRRISCKMDKMDGLRLDRLCLDACSDVRSPSIRIAALNTLVETRLLWGGEGLFVCMNALFDESEQVRNHARKILTGDLPKNLR